MARLGADREHATVRLLDDGHRAEASVVSPPDGPAFQRIARAARATMGIDTLVVAPYLVVGGTDRCKRPVCVWSRCGMAALPCITSCETSYMRLLHRTTAHTPTCTMTKYYDNSKQCSSALRLRIRDLHNLSVTL